MTKSNGDQERIGRENEWRKGVRRNKEKKSQRRRLMMRWTWIHRHTRAGQSFILETGAKDMRKKNE